MRKVTLLSLMLAGAAIYMPLAGNAQAKKAKAKPVAATKTAPAAASGYKVANGVEYKMVKDVPGKNAEVGDVIEAHIVWKVTKNKNRPKDSVLVDTRIMNAGKPISMPLQAPKFPGDMSGGLALMSAGDSAVIRIAINALKKSLPDQPMPPFAKDGDYFIYEVNMVSIKNKEEVEKDMKQHAAEQNQTDDKLIQEYLAKNNIKGAAKTASGVYYTIQTPGTGDNLSKGKNVSIKYSGKTLDDKVFDSNMEEGKPLLPINVGAGGVIPGMDESLLVMKKGTKGTIYIPSSLAYGERGQGPIPANAVLIFDMEIVEVK